MHVEKAQRDIHGLPRCHQIVSGWGSLRFRSQDQCSVIEGGTSGGGRGDPAQANEIENKECVAGDGKKLRHFGSVRKGSRGKIREISRDEIQHNGCLSSEDRLIINKYWKFCKFVFQPPPPHPWSTYTSRSYKPRFHSSWHFILTRPSAFVIIHRRWMVSHGYAAIGGAMQGSTAKR